MEYITNRKPKKQTVGATFILLTLKISGSKCVIVVDGPHISNVILWAKEKEDFKIEH